MAADDGFRYLSPWLPMAKGWYRIGHVGARAGDRVHRWRLYEVHENNTATGERWKRWRLFYDAAKVINDGAACSTWDVATELPGEVRDRGHAGELVEQRFADLCSEAVKERRRAKA